MIEFISQPWHWAVSGAMIALLMFSMLLAGEKFGVSSSFETICSIGGAGKRIELFNFDWRKQSWLLTFVGGSIIGGFIASHYLQSPEPVQISEATRAYLQAHGVMPPQSNAEGLGYVPEGIFNLNALMTLRGFIMMVLGGFFVGFGTRWASGCTSGHAISGLSNLQLPSLIAVIGFFIGGLTMTHLLLPFILQL